VQRVGSAPQFQHAIAAIGLTAIALIVAMAMTGLRSGSYDVWVVVLLGPMLFVATLPALGRQALREQNPRLFWFLVSALVLKLVSSLVRYYITFEVYERADARDYHEWGVTLFRQFRDLNFETDLDLLSSTNFIRYFTGLVYAVIGPSKLGGFVLYSWLGFIGLFHFYRAFVTALPDGNRRMYGLFVFFLPTLLYWPSSIGKESWMMFGLGIACYGCARVLAGSTFGGLLPLGLGLWLSGLVRPHMAGLVAVSLAAAAIVRKPKSELRELAPIAKVLMLTSLGLLALFLTVRTSDFLQDKGIDTNTGVTDVIEQTSARTSSGGSQFAPTVLESPLRAPIAVATVLFRPFIFEAHNLQALAAAVEGSFLAIFSLVRWRSAVEAITRLRHSPYIGFVLIYSILFIVAFSGMANFGLLVRERTQLMPLYILMFCCSVGTNNGARDAGAQGS
jgi:hypothetical protein